FGTVRRHVLENGGRLSPDIEGLGAGDRRRNARRREESNERGRVGCLERPKDDSVDDGKNCGVGADAERQRENRDIGKAWLPAKGSKCVRNILPQFTHVGTCTFLTPLLGSALRSAKLTCC